MKQTPSRGSWLLLDPPSGEGYARRGSLREKTDALRTPFPNIDLILLSGAVSEAGYQPVFIDAQIRRWTWRRLFLECRKIQVCGVTMLLSSNRADEELSQVRQLHEVLGSVPIYVISTIYMVLDANRSRTMLEQHGWLRGIVLNTAENNFGEVIVSDDVAPSNVVVRRGCEIVAPLVSVTYGEDLRIPRPVHAIFKNPRYFFPQSKRTPVTCVQLSFGCPYTCEFCLDNALYRKMRYRNVDDVIEELVEIDGLGFREAYFKDLTFGLHKRITTEFLDKLAARRLRLRWLCTTRLDVATPRLLELMKKAGCYGIEFGLESGLRHRRAANGKPIDDSAVRTVFGNCRSRGIETTAFIMIGFEDEKEEEIRHTMRFVESLQPDYASYNVVNALPGTPLERRAREEGFLRDADSDHTFTSTNIKHKYLTPERLEALRSEAVKSFYRRPSTAAMRLLRLRSFFEFRKLVRLSRVAL